MGNLLMELREEFRSFFCFTIY